MFIDKIRNAIADRWLTLAERCVAPLIEKGLSPNTITLFGLILSVIAALFYGAGLIFLGGIFLIAGAFMDTLDGRIARSSNRSSDSGALFDSTMDRYSEFVVFCGVLFYFRDGWMFFVTFLALVGSVMVSYVRARAQSLGEDRKVGWAQRPERLGILITGSILNGPVSLILPGSSDFLFILAIISLAAAANVTALQRLRAGFKGLTRKNEPLRETRP